MMMMMQEEEDSEDEDVVVVVVRVSSDYSQQQPDAGDVRKKAIGCYWCFHSLSIEILELICSSMSHSYHFVGSEILGFMLLAYVAIPLTVSEKNQLSGFVMPFHQPLIEAFFKFLLRFKSRFL